MKSGEDGILEVKSDLWMSSSPFWLSCAPSMSDP